MADTTSIEWTDATWNVLTGCSIVSPGCTHCYAMRLAATRLRNHPSREGLTKEVNGNHVWNGVVRFNEQWLLQPMAWRRGRKIFVCAHSDLFHEAVQIEWLDKIWATMALAQQHDFQVLTKRAGAMWNYLTAPDWSKRVMRWVRELAPGPNWNGNIAQAEFELSHVRPALPNVWIGTSAEDQTRAGERMPFLMNSGLDRWHRFVSAEPLLGPLNLRPWLEMGLEWVISGGESGPGARPTDPQWHRQLRDDCAEFDRLFLFKQWGAWHADALRYTDLECRCPPPNMRVGKKVSGRLLDGREHNDVPTRKELA